MASLGNYLNTIMDLKQGNITIGDAWKAATSTKGGVLGAPKPKGGVSRDKSSSDSFQPMYPNNYFQDASTDKQWNAYMGGGNGIKQASGGNAGASNSSKSLSDQQDALRKKLGGSFGSTIDAYGKMIGWLPDEQSNLTMQVEGLANNQKQSVNDALASALEKFTGYRGEVASNQKQTLQDLADNTRNLFAAGNNYLEARGAGQSSATGMYSAALTQQANKQRADVQNQTNSMYNDINMQESDTKANAQQQLDAIETWKSTRVSEIVQQYQDLKRQLTLAKAQANDAKKQALAKLDASLFESAVNKLNSLQGMADTYKSEVSNLMQQQNGQMQGVLQGIGKGAQYDVQDIQTVPLDGIEQGQSMADDTIVGFYNGRKVQIDQQGNVLAYLD